MTRTPGRELQQTFGEWLTPTRDQADRVALWVAAHSVPTRERAASWWEEDDFVVFISSPFPTRVLEEGNMPVVIQRLWLTFEMVSKPLDPRS